MEELKTITAGELLRKHSKTTSDRRFNARAHAFSIYASGGELYFGPSESNGKYYTDITLTREAKLNYPATYIMTFVPGFCEVIPCILDENGDRIASCVMGGGYDFESFTDTTQDFHGAIHTDEYTITFKGNGFSFGSVNNNLNALAQKLVDNARSGNLVDDSDYAYWGRKLKKCKINMVATLTCDGRVSGALSSKDFGDSESGWVYTS